MPGASVQYRYSASGQLQGQTEQGTTTLAGVQTYRFDATERLLGTDSPLGSLSYSYDAAGNLTERSVANPQASAGTSGHQYDAAGRLAQVTAPDGKQTTYSYDAAGRRVSTERQLNPVAAGQAQAGQAQSLITHQRHDTADRIIAIAQGQYLFFAPRYRYVTWSHLTQWYRSFFRPERVQQIKQFARSKKWAYRKLPVLVGVKNESLVGFGADFDGWNELIAVEEYVLPATHAASEALLTYLRDWEQVFTGYVYRDIPRSSRVQMAGESGLMTALHTSPLVGQEAAMKREVKHSTKLLLEVHDCWSADEVLAHLSTQDTAPALFRYDLVPDMPVADSMKKDWQELYELRVAYLEKFAFPWFYRPALAMLGAEGPRHSLTALQLVEQGVRPLSQPLCPEEFRERVGRVALKLERAYPILAREPVPSAENSLLLK